MPVTVFCPDCSKKYSVPEERVGSAFRCKVCKAEVPVEAEQESELVKNRKKKVRSQEKAVARASERKKQSLMKVAGILAAVAILVGIGITAQMVPAFRETLGKVLLAGGITCFIFAWFGTLWNEEELLLRMLIRYFPPAIFISLLMRLDETWPFLLLALGGVIATVLGLMMGAA
jgi:hypothetical protein